MGKFTHRFQFYVLFFTKCTFLLAVELEVWPGLESGRVGLFACGGKLRQRETLAINSLHTADDYDLDLGILGAGVGGLRFHGHLESMAA